METDVGDRETHAQSCALRDGVLAFSGGLCTQAVLARCSRHVQRALSIEFQHR